MVNARGVIAAEPGTCERPIRVGVSDPEQRGHTGVGARLLGGDRAGTVQAPEQAQGPAVERLIVATERQRGQRFGDCDLYTATPCVRNGGPVGEPPYVGCL